MEMVLDIRKQLFVRQKMQESADQTIPRGRWED